MHHIDIASFWPGYTVIAQALSANHHTLFTLEPRADLLPRCRRCLQPTPLIHD
ncbi:ISL3 family transposase, partial [Aeromonas caviae]